MDYISAQTIRDRLRAEQQKQDALDQMIAADPAFVDAVTTVNNYFKALSIHGEPSITVPVASVGLSVSRFLNWFRGRGYFVANDDTNISVMLYAPPVNP
jgi:hypothetical protein